MNCRIKRAALWRHVCSGSFAPANMIGRVIWRTRETRRVANGKRRCAVAECMEPGASSDGKIDSNRFTLPNRNEKFRFSTTATTWLRAFTVLQDRVMTRIRVNVATRFCKGN